jgi:hypothetical protein
MEIVQFGDISPSDSIWSPLQVLLTAMFLTTPLSVTYVPITGLASLKHEQQGLILVLLNQNYLPDSGQRESLVRQASGIDHREIGVYWPCYIHSALVRKCHPDHAARSCGILQKKTPDLCAYCLQHIIF